jgi:cell division protein FtsA
MKSQSSSKNIIVAVDIGTTKICVLVAQKITANQFEILGIGKAPSVGIARGIVVDITQAVVSIRQAIKEAELMSGYKIQTVYAGVSGSHINAVSSQGMVPIKSRNVKQIDINAVIAAAQAIVIPEGQQIIHVLPRAYKIDGQLVKDPHDMFGVRLEAEMHIITGSVAAVQNIFRCCQLAGVEVKDIILEPLASADSVLSEDEKELGIGMLDIGGGTSDFVVFGQGSINFTKVIAIAGNHITQDIALCLRTSIKDAERIKKDFSNACFNESIDLNKRFDVEMVQGGTLKTIGISDLIEVASCRVTELFALLKLEIDRHDLAKIMPAGLVLTGGGSLMNGITQSAENILNMPVRWGRPNVIEPYSESLESPVYATSYGLLLQILKKENSVDLQELNGPLVNKVLWRMKSWITDFF